ncbi:MAG: STAS domain-containing protein [Phycisphaerales bacterium]|nr:MAG: STAS domain-containing protein [Phycisphaerales bacterium]
MEIKEQKQGAVTILRPQGPLAQDSAEALKTRAHETIKRDFGRVIIDGSEISYVDSRGLEALQEVNDEMAASGRSLKLCGLNETVREVLDLTDLAPQFDLYEDTNTAVRSFL